MKGENKKWAHLWIPWAFFHYQKESVKVETIEDELPENYIKMVTAKGPTCEILTQWVSEVTNTHSSMLSENG